MDTRSRPPLGDRFILAYKLTSSIIEFHKVEWVHKSISPHNIAFFHLHGSKPHDWIRNPFIVGFNRSRPDDPKAFTTGPAAVKDQHKKYHHPLYLEHQRFMPEFDYYSLGLVLLEIGLWKLLDDMTVSYKYSSWEELRQTLLLKRVPLLEHAMGTSYREAVDSCLNANGVTHHSSQLKSLDPAIPSHLKLGHQVLEALSKCPHEANGIFGMPVQRQSSSMLLWDST
jgi:hypothetical protein